MLVGINAVEQKNIFLLVVHHPITLMEKPPLLKVTLKLCIVIGKMVATNLIG